MAIADTAAVGGRRSITGTPLLIGTLGLLGAGLAVEVAVGASNPFLPVIVLIAVAQVTLGTAVARRRPGHPVAWVLQGAALVGAVVVLTGAHVDAVLAGALPEAGLTLTLWLNRWLWVLLAATPAALLFAFPDGRLPSPRWRPVAWLAAGCVVLFLIQAMGRPFEESFWRDVPVRNPLGDAGARLAAALGPWPALALVAANALGAAALVVRRRASAGDLGQRLRWVVPAALLMPLALAFSLVGRVEWGGTAEMAAGVLLMVTVTVATVRHRMFDADVALNRTVIYGLLVAGLLGAYVAVVATVSAAVTVPWLPGVVGAAVVAVAFGPLLHLLQRRADELLFGERRSPALVANRLLEVSATDDDPDARDRATLDRAAATLRASLRLPWVRLQTAGLDVTVGEPRTVGLPLPLRREDRELGMLVVGRRYDDERLGADDPALSIAAAQLALTVDVLLTARELRRARDRMARARTEERQRIRRDLHDGLGPALTGVSLGLESAAEIAARDPTAAAALLPELSVHAREATADLRRLVDGIRPPDLEAVGLAEALGTRLALLAAGGDSPALDVDVAADLGELPDGVAVAAYRICLEAVTNVVRHAAAQYCRVRVVADATALTLEVDDDGRGVGEAVAHVGLTSMQERAEQVGGSVTVSDRPGGGTLVRATLPIGVVA